MGVGGLIIQKYRIYGNPFEVNFVVFYPTHLPIVSIMSEKIYLNIHLTCTFLFVVKPVKILGMLNL